MADQTSEILRAIEFELAKRAVIYKMLRRPPEKIGSVGVYFALDLILAAVEYPEWARQIHTEGMQTAAARGPEAAAALQKNLRDIVAAIPVQTIHPPQEGTDDSE